jgi:hypothetical protein
MDVMIASSFVSNAERSTAAGAFEAAKADN